jgi:hypothetical protein
MSEADRFFPYFAVPLFGPQPDNRDVSRAYVREGLCPICGAGPFAVVALHVQRKHDVDKDELRDMLGVYKGTSICDEGHSAAMRRRSKQRFTPERLERMQRARAVGKGTRQLSTAAIERNRRLSVQHRDQAVAYLRASVEERRDETRQRDEQMRGRWEAGLSLSEIGQQFGIHSKTVREGLERLGMDLGRETLRRRKNWSAEGLEQGRESHRRRMAEVQRRRVEQFNAGGGTWETVEQMARREGVTCKSMRTALARAGADVPDGRAASSARFGKGDARRGRINPHRGLTPDQVEEIGRLHAGGGVTQRDLAERYGVSGSHDLAGRSR